MQECLVIVDMQDYFLGNLDSISSKIVNNPIRRTYLIECILREIKNARKKGMPIICLEYADLDYDGDGIFATYTCKEIRLALRNYRKAYYALKDQNDGSEEIIDIMNGVIPRRDIPRNTRTPVKYLNNGEDVKAYICGVNLDACVRETEYGLLDKGHDAVLIADCVRNVYDDDCLDPSMVNSMFNGEKIRA